MDVGPAGGGGGAGASGGEEPGVKVASSFVHPSVARVKDGDGDAPGRTLSSSPSSRSIARRGSTRWRDTRDKIRGDTRMITAADEEVETTNQRAVGTPKLSDPFPRPTNPTPLRAKLEEGDEEGGQGDAGGAKDAEE